MTKKRTIKRFLFFCFTMAAFIIVVGIVPQVRAAEYEEGYYDIALKAKSASTTSVKLSWQNIKKVKKWNIKLALYDKKGKKKTYKKVATVKKGRHSFTVKKLKKNRSYTFTVEGYAEVNGLIRTYREDIDFYTGLEKPWWSDYDREWPFSTSYITLKGVMGTGLPHSGVEIWRKASGSSKYKKIKVLKTKKHNFTYKDKNVKKGVTYRYKFRVYRKVKKKKTYSGFTEPLIRVTRNFTGDYKIELTEKNRDSFVIKVTGSKYNCTLKIPASTRLIMLPPGTKYNGKYHEEYELPAAKLKEWSKDGTSWQTGDAIIDGGKTVYLRVSYESNEDIYEEVLEKCSFCDEYDDGGSTYYNGVYSYLYFNIKGSGTVEMDTASYH